jgi:hypothetical protein
MASLGNIVQDQSGLLNKTPSQKKPTTPKSPKQKQTKSTHCVVGMQTSTTTLEKI